MQGELPILSNDSSGDLLLQNHDSVHNPELEEESIYYKPSQHATALTIGSNLVSALETGLRFANVISSSSFHMAASINSATADFADRSKERTVMTRCCILLTFSRNYGNCRSINFFH